jgi:hypothetical protein
LVNDPSEEDMPRIWVEQFLGEAPLTPADL